MPGIVMGTVVHYVDRDSFECPAIVVEKNLDVHENETLLEVFTPGKRSYQVLASLSSDQFFPGEPYTWHWSCPL